MGKRKIRIFLGAYVNFPNAQNINCDNIAKYLNKDKFEVHVMYSSKIPIDKREYRKQNIYLHRLIHHRFIWYWCKYLTMLLGNYDIYYLPKMESVDSSFANRHKGKIFLSSVEGVVGGQISENDRITTQYFNNVMTNYFSISECIGNSVRKYWKRDTTILHLGLNAQKNKPRIREEVRTVIWIGSMIDRKRPQWILECAKIFPILRFIMIGDGDMQEEISRVIEAQSINNVTCLGRIQNDRVYKELQKADLLLMTSDKEGLPKVIGEAMISGVPAIYINTYYSVDYIENEKNGYAVADFDEMVEKMQYLIDHPDVFRKLSEKAYRTIQKYTWDKLIKKYEEYFIEQYQKHK